MTLLNKWNKLNKFLLDLIFPNRCPFCGEFIVWDKLACDHCIDEIAYSGNELCACCGKSPCICGDELHYEKCFAAVYYEGIVRDGIFRLKTKNGLNAAEFFSAILAEKILAQSLKIDFIVPVPMTRKKQSVRGYNQAEELARFLSRRLRVPVNTKILQKNSDDVEQHTLGAQERMQHAKELFSVKQPAALQGKTVLICDDVMTTGSTMNACALLLKNLGSQVYLAAGATTSQKL